VIGCSEGRSSANWVDFDFYGLQLVAHLAPDECGHKSTGSVDGHEVKVRHFGAIISLSEWEALATRCARLASRSSSIRFKGERGEQATMFFLDPSDNALELKAFADLSQVFAK